MAGEAVSKKGQVRDHQCPHCSEKFTEKGLPGHIAMKHQRGGAGEAKGTQQQAGASASISTPKRRKEDGGQAAKPKGTDRDFCGFEPFS